METRKRTPLKPVKKASPEKGFFTRLLGKPVEVYLLNTDEVIVGDLLWVDAYTLLVKRFDSGIEELIYKHGVERIRAEKQNSYRGQNEKHRRRVIQ